MTLFRLLISGEGVDDETRICMQMSRQAGAPDLSICIPSGGVTFHRCINIFEEHSPNDTISRSERQKCKKGGHGFLCKNCHHFHRREPDKEHAGCISQRKGFDNSMGLTLLIFFYQIECCKKRVDKSEAGHKGGLIFKEQSTPPIQGCHCCTFKDGGEANHAWAFWMGLRKELNGTRRKRRSGGV